ncbi:Formyl-coenzyme A transferase [Sporomusa ovata DSM 2662]|uniref:CAIB/BAIF family protein n=1 Tax=Sporomusa ovata TaxID=2378 RepID=A0A0U1KZT1_9FIRM|nr:CoA transferase [Sporomusa ovata]EQB27988.1 formyl-CoA transferase [Sporomusa ovata DSM 2662]CQR72928.1 CAIB/BAIF family protein [Sporomusa ovata]
MPLKNIVVLDLTRVLAGPFATSMLADFGATIIKVEPPGGDDARSYGPFIGTESRYFMGLNRGKQSMTLNLKNPQGQAMLKEMVQQVDVLIENYRPGVMEKFGLGYETLKKINPKLIYAACSGFGQTGPYRSKSAYDITVQGIGGIMSVTGQETGEPTRVGIPFGDILPGLYIVNGILLALYHRQQTGKGQMVDVSMLDCQVAVMDSHIGKYFATGVVQKPIGNRHPTVTPLESFKTQDGYVIVAAGNEKTWEKFCLLLDCPQLLADERFLSNNLRTQNRDELKQLLDPVFITKTSEEWIKLLEAAGIPCGIINTIDKVVEDPQVLARKMIVEVNHSVAGKVKLTGIPIKMSESPGCIRDASPLLGEHTDKILHHFLGLDTQKIYELREKRII